MNTINNPSTAWWPVPNSNKGPKPTASGQFSPASNLIGNEQTESRLQADITQWFWNTYPEHRGMLFHVNNKARNAIEGNKFKAMGVVKGVSDLVLVLPQGRILFIELKTPTGSQEAAQKEWQAKVQERGHNYIIIRSLEEFKALIAPVLTK
ncbi:VRR-NUC domain-containing protein [Arachidicoccus rhizosphaerae]|uniref:VRR-NUC domain-containing protein n=1 Tax=Arachidicoccus rhizosphaerae TaxID=551991 RepID=A0A1H4CGG7_9BACT|nr:VRR-NUC domain-containing protein [Arachidicoccus rhizosphaerae]SEA59515.1 VRR-NUC domain-containing protein [Arachidicoccus rhizosphaerae]